jgi:hypothetical protein
MVTTHTQTPSSAEARPVPQHGGPDVGQQAVDEDLAGRDGLAAPDDAVLELHDVAVLADEDVVLQAAGRDRDVAVGPQMAVLAVDRDDVLGLDDVVEQDEVVAAGVTGHVDVGEPLVDHLRAPPRQPVDRAEHGVLVAGDQARGEDDRVALPDLDVLVVAGGHQRLSAEYGSPCCPVEITIRSGAVVRDVLDLDLELRVEVEVAEAPGDRHVLDHRPADEHGAAADLGGGVEHLLDPVDVRRERGDDHEPLGVADLVAQRASDGALGRDVAGHVGVGRVREQQVDALVTEAGEVRQVGGHAVDRGLVELEVAGVHDDPVRGPEREGAAVGDRVADLDDLDREGPVLDGLGRPVTSTISGGSRSSHSSRIASTNASVSLVP